ALILAEKPGFRTALQSATNDAKPVEIVLVGTDETPAVAYRTIASALPVEEEKALARRLIEPLVTRVVARGDDDAKFVVLSDAAEIDPQRTIEWLDEARFGDPALADEVRGRLATALAPESLDDAAAIIEACTSPNVRAYGYVGLIDMVPGLTP